MSKSSRWMRLAEVGSLAGLKLMQGFYRLFGRRASRALLYPVAAYFFLRHRTIRDSSQRYLEALFAFPGGAEALGRPPGRREIFRHLHEFSINIFDRMVVWGGSLRRMEFEKRRSIELLELARRGRGGILVGAHLGSFDMLRLIADHHRVIVNVLMYTENAEQINAFFERLDPNSRVRVLPIDPSAVRTPFVIRRCVERGEFVGILSDRVNSEIGERPERIPFLGRPAGFPSTPFEIAAVLGCPLLLCLCVRTGDARYEAFARTLFDGKPVPRRERPKVVHEMMAAYVAELESWCLRAPYQWFNFYDFWAS